MFSPENKKQRLVQIWGKMRNGTSQDFTLFLINWYCGIWLMDEIGKIEIQSNDSETFYESQWKFFLEYVYSDRSVKNFCNHHNHKIAQFSMIKSKCSIFLSLFK